MSDKDTQTPLPNPVNLKQQVEQLTQSQLADLPQFLQATFDALSAHIAVLDASGTIIAVNAAWRRFAEANHLNYPAWSIGANYLEICEAVSGEETEEALTAARGIRQIIAQQSDEFHLEYPCHSSQEQRWFMMRASRLEDNGTGWVIVTHENITERKQAELALTYYTRRMTALSITFLEISTHLDVSTLFQAIVRRAAELLETEMGGLFLVQTDSQMLKLVVGHNQPNHFLGTILQAGEGLSGRILQTGQPLMIADYRRWEGRVASMAKANIGRILGVPLKRADRVIGIINVFDREKTGVFSDDDVRLLSLFAVQAAIALENAQLYEEVRHRVDELITLNEISQALTSTLDLQETLTIITNHITRLLEVAAASVILHDRDQGDLWFAAASGEGSNFIRGKRLAQGQGIGGWVVQHGQPLLVPDVSKDPRFWANFDEAQGFTTRSILCVPLETKGQTIGAIEVINKVKGRGFEQEDLRLLSSLAGPAATAIENAQLYEQAQQEIARRRQTEETLREREDLFRQVVTSISDHIYVTRMAEDGSRLNLYLSPHVEALTGYPPEIVRDNWHFWASELIHPDDRAAAAIQVAALAKGQNSEVEYRLIHADGHIIWVRDSARVQVEGDSRVVFGLVSDITERKQTEQEIRKLNETLEQRVADRTRELSALYDVTAVASESLDLGTILERLLARSLAAMRSGMGAIHTLDETGKALRLDVQQALPADIVAQAALVPIGRGLSGWVIEHGEPLLVPNLAVDPRAPRAVHKYGLKTYVGVPMRTGGQTVGVLSVFGEALQQFNMEEMALLASIGDQVGVVIENARLRQRAEQAAVMEERERLARDLHDAVSQSLFSASVIAEALPRFWERDPNLVQQSLADLHRLTRGALAEMRALLLELRPAALVETELDKLLGQLIEAIIGRTRLDASLEMEGQLRLPLEVKLNLYRIAQEALNNISKHARASRISVRLNGRPDRVLLCIRDDGRGFNPHQVSLDHLGLSIMQERAEAIGATLTITSRADYGTEVVVVWPRR
jgi:PAS domain S-box-containing protein